MTALALDGPTIEIKSKARRSAKSSPDHADLELSKSARDEAASVLAQALVADAVSLALNIDGRSLRALSQATGLDAPFLSRLAAGKSCTVNSLAKLAIGLNKKLYISIE